MGRLTFIPVLSTYLETQNENADIKIHCRFGTVLKILLERSFVNKLCVSTQSSHKYGQFTRQAFEQDINIQNNTLN